MMVCSTENKGNWEGLESNWASALLCSSWVQNAEKELLEKLYWTADRAWGRNSTALVFHFKRDARTAQITENTKQRRVASKKNTVLSNPQSKMWLFCRRQWIWNARSRNLRTSPVSTYTSWLSTYSSQRVSISISLPLTRLTEQVQRRQMCLFLVSTEDCETTRGVHILLKVYGQNFLFNGAKSLGYLFC